MVKIINNSVCRGVAGKRAGNVKGVVIHNTWTNTTAEQEMNRLACMSAKQLEAGFAHYYADENTIVRTEDTFNRAWHVANTDGNNSYIGYEVRGNRETPKAIFLQAEQNVFWQAAIDLRYYGLPVNRDTVKCHHQFSATECPKRSLMEHCGYDSPYAVPAEITAEMQDYFISQIKKYYDNPNLQPDGGTNSNESNSNHPKTHDEIVAASKPKHQGNAIGKLDFYNGYTKDQIRVAGWLVPDKANGAIGSTAWVLFMEHGTGKELTRVQSKGIKRPDVKKAYSYQGGDALGFDVTVSKKQFKGKKVDIILRRANNGKNGESPVNDVRIDDVYLTL
ncbi:N-acetylmuramoyl-L-alanine amidase [Enterococcus thailandicus]|uniref:peptidoglycan recognition protein family protein n=1 Tax=Enterococcus thailandicus TaxID=417368 RepID=UPI0028924600|nr:N-acetylmuramoyl-L-alanine amidase [Enterococcus thailandicus]MDT2750432.1 N-acetylmuramoyl-L-alanine amidase [Enterococcus thailandicus]MDT2774993.1 N-acetylmuramoyl-L-alanine amidase [Enterococcus thailandicus]